MSLKEYITISNVQMYYGEIRVESAAFQDDIKSGYIVQGDGDEG